MIHSKLIIGLLAGAGLAFTGAAAAAPISKDAYNAENKRIEATYKVDKEACSSKSGNAKDVCIERAKAKEKVAKAENEAALKDTEQARIDARVAKAEADYAVASEKCDDLSGDRKDACVKEAKAVEARAKADAKAGHAMNTTTTTRTAAEPRLRHDDTAADKRERGESYRLAIEKCNSMSGSARDSCVTDAKARFGG
jgi:hypothetical protein